MPIPHATGTRAAIRNSERTLRPEFCAWNTFAAWLLVLPLAAGAPAFAADEIRITETRSIPLGDLQAAGDASHELRLTLHTFHGTRWSREQISAAVRHATGLLGQCRVALTHAELHVVEAPRRFHFYSTPVSRELLKRMPVAKPALFFVEDTLNRPAYDAEAIGRGNSASRPELADTVWIAYGARDLPQALTHELVHVLADSGDHSEEPENLMRAETSPRNTRLTAAQCEQLRSRGEAAGLLTR